MVKWEGFALHLPGIRQSDIDDINAKRHDDLDDQKNLLFNKWLEKFPNGSWEQVVLALEKSDQIIIADDLQASVDPGCIQIHNETAEWLLTLDKEFCIVKAIFRCEMEESIESGAIKLSELIKFAEDNEQIYKFNDEVCHVQDFIRIVSYHYNLFDYELLSDLVKMFLKSSHDLSKKLQEHDHNMDNFWECTMIENLRNALRPYVKKFKDEVPVEIKGCKMVGMKKRNVIKDLIKVIIDGDDKKMRLFRIISGSLTIVVLLQQHVSQALLGNFNKEKIAFLRLVGVFSLQVGTKYILEDDEDTEYTFEKGFVNAVQASNYEAVEFLLQQIGVDVDTPIEQSDEDSIIIAADFNDANKVFLDNNNKVFLVLDIGATALIVACYKNDFKMMQLLLQQQKQPGPNLCTQSGWTALMYTAINGNTTILKALLDIKADVNMRKHSDGATAVMYASLVGNVEIIKLLIQHVHSADLNLRLNDG